MFYVKEAICIFQLRKWVSLMMVKKMRIQVLYSLAFLKVKKKDIFFSDGYPSSFFFFFCKFWRKLPEIKRRKISTLYWEFLLFFFFAISLIRRPLASRELKARVHWGFSIHWDWEIKKIPKSFLHSATSLTQIRSEIWLREGPKKRRGGGKGIIHRWSC